jgi:Homeodomain-like domain
MNKKYIVRLTDEERAICEATVKKETGKSEKLRRATILLKADADGPAWDDSKIGEAVGCRTRTVENVRQAFVLEGFEEALTRKKRATPPTPKLLDGVAEAKLLALRLGKPPVGFGSWTLRLLADQMVELEIVEAISPETVRQTLKKMA